MHVSMLSTMVLHSHVIAAAKANLSDAEARDVVALAKSIVDSCGNYTVLYGTCTKIVK